MLRLTVRSILLASTFALVACGGAEGGMPAQDPTTAGTVAKSDIVDTAANAGSFKTLIAAVKAADLESTLRGPGPFTVFAPTDEAFAKLPAGTVESLLNPCSRQRRRSHPRRTADEAALVDGGRFDVSAGAPLWSRSRACPASRSSSAPATGGSPGIASASRVAATTGTCTPPVRA